MVDIKKAKPGAKPEFVLGERRIPPTGKKKGTKVRDIHEMGPQHLNDFIEKLNKNSTTRRALENWRDLHKDQEESDVRLPTRDEFNSMVNTLKGVDVSDEEVHAVGEVFETHPDLPSKKLLEKILERIRPKAEA